MTFHEQFKNLNWHELYDACRTFYYSEMAQKNEIDELRRENKELRIQVDELDYKLECAKSEYERLKNANNQYI